MKISLIILLFSQIAIASHYEVDPTHSNIGFTIRHFVSKVSGQFKDFKGTIDFDEKKLTALQGQLEIQATSIDTGNAKRDEHLRSEDFFDVSKNPLITFKATAITATSKGKFKAVGDFTMHGVKQSITLNGEYLGRAKDFEGSYRAGFTLNGKIKRKDFKMVWNKILDAGNAVLGDDVDLQIQVEAKENVITKAAPDKK